jgi:beta-aspartyl-peptidase (threonine type)
MSWLLVGSENAAIGFPSASSLLGAGGSATDAVLTAIRAVERNLDDHSVGAAGLPNLLGDVELDASIMEGTGLRAGAVGALRDHGDAIDLAYRVMRELPHSFLAGEGAGRFAKELGFPVEDLLTDESRSIWERRAKEAGERSSYFRRMRELVAETTSDPQFPEPPHGTVDVIAIDQSGAIVCGVSTSGWAWKYPGRLGDSPVIGAGNYADARYGAAACTGRGEMALRCCSAHSVVTFLRFGMPLDAALTLAAEDLRQLDDPYASEMNIVAVTADGRHGGVSTNAGKTYVWQSADVDGVQTSDRLHVPLSD